MKYLVCDILEPYIFTLQWNEFVSLGRKLNFLLCPSGGFNIVHFFHFLFLIPSDRANLCLRLGQVSLCQMKPVCPHAGAVSSAWGSVPALLSLSLSPAPGLPAQHVSPGAETRAVTRCTVRNKK